MDNLLVEVGVLPAEEDKMLGWITLLRSITCLLRWITFFQVYTLPVEVGNLLVEVDYFPHDKVGSVLADTAVVEVMFAEGSLLTVAVNNPVGHLAALCMAVV